MAPDTPPDAVADVTDAIGHPVRAAIASELAGRPEGTASFTALRDAVGLRDNGRFNYHLARLQDGLVESDGDGRYALTPRGREAAHLLRAGHLAEPDRVRELRTGTACHTCGGPLQLTCRPTCVAVDCLDCEWHLDWSIRLPRSAFEADPGHAAAVVDRRLRDAGRTLADGLCPDCTAPVEAGLTATDGDGPALDVVVQADCPDCGRLRTPPGLLALTHDATGGFFHDHGVALADRAVWAFDFAMTDHHTRVRTRQPWRVEVRPQIDTDELVLLVDESAAVSAVRRHTKFAARDVWYPNRVRG